MYGNEARVAWTLRRRLSLLRLVRTAPYGECWPWEGYVDRDGYGRRTIDGLNVFVHRAVYHLMWGEIPPLHVLDHECHTRDIGCPGGRDCLHRPCCNPTHHAPVLMLENTMRGQSIPAQRARLRVA